MASQILLNNDAFWENKPSDISDALLLDTNITSYAKNQTVTAKEIMQHYKIGLAAIM